MWTCYLCCYLYGRPLVCLLSILSLIKVQHSTTLLPLIAPLSVACWSDPHRTFVMTRCLVDSTTVVWRPIACTLSPIAHLELLNKRKVTDGDHLSLNSIVKLLWKKSVKCQTHQWKIYSCCHKSPQDKQYHNRTTYWKSQHHCFYHCPQQFVRSLYW